MSEIPTEPRQPPSLTLFFVATFGVTWAFWVPAALLFGEGFSGGSPFDTPILVLLQTLGAAGPSVVAYWLLRRRGGRVSVQSIVLRYRLWRDGLYWYFVAALLVPAIQLAGLVVGGLRGDGPLVEPSSQLGQMLGDLGLWGAMAVFPVIIIAQLPTSPLLEEFGWRGFALPRLQDRYSALTSSVILGLLWGLWHLPLTLAYGDPFIPFLLRITAITVLMTWVFNSTGGNMLLAMLLHASLNASIVPLTTEAGRWPSVLIAIAAALAVVAVRGGRDLADRPRIRWSTSTGKSLE